MCRLFHLSLYESVSVFFFSFFICLALYLFPLHPNATNTKNTKHNNKKKTRVMLFFFFVIIPGCFNLLSFFFFFFVSCFHILPKATITETKQNKAKEEGEIVRSDVHGQESRALLLCFLPAVFGPLFAELRKNKNNNNNNNNSNSTFSAL